MTVEEETAEETLPFREPSGNFRDILSRWKAHDKETDLTQNPMSIAAHACRKKKAGTQKPNNHHQPSSTVGTSTGSLSSDSAHRNRRHFVAEQSSNLEDPHAAAILLAEEESHHDDHDDTDPSPQPPPLQKNITAMIDKFNHTAKLSDIEVEPMATMPPALLKRYKTVGDTPVDGTPAVGSTGTVNVTITTPSSGAKKNWSKLKVVGVAAKASVRLRNRLVKRDRLPKNIYQKPLISSVNFVPPIFQHTPDELTVIRQALKKNFVFADLKETELLPLIQAFEKCTYVANEKIIRQGSAGDYFYIIHLGKVNFDVSGTTVGRAGKGNSFGELALLYTCPRAATVTAYRDCILFRVDQNSFRFILRNQTKKSEQAKIDLLKGVDFFSELAAPDIEKLSHVMTPLVFSPDTVLCKKGDMGDKFYVLQEGTVLITDISVGSTRYEDLTLGPGQYWGERSLVTGEPRAANVIAKSYGVAFTIDRGMFQKTFGHLSSMVSRSQDGRRLAGVRLIQNANLTAAQLTALAQAMKDVTFRSGTAILQKGELTSPALYFVRDGSVKVEKRESVVEILPGGFFGEEVMQLAVKNYMPSVPSPISATCIGKTVLAELKLSKCRNIFDVQLLAGRSSEAFSLGEVDDSDGDDDQEDIVVERLKTLRSKRQDSLKPKVRPKVKLNDLEKVKLLGAGTFGQVWLVSDKSKSGKAKSVFALKVQTKWDLVQEGQVAAVIQERNIMNKMFHPFIVDFVASFQDERFVYMVIDLIQGGELFSRIHDLEEDHDGLAEDQAKFYALCIADALAYLHRLGYVFRDMKPENVMLDVQGYPKLIDFGFAKHITEKTFTLCGTPGYLPPEIVMSRGHDWSSDHWSLGVLIYDMLTGLGPFYREGMDQMTLFQRIVEVDYDEPAGSSSLAKDIIDKLLQKEPLQRLGSLSGGEEDILQHPWFSGLDLSAMRARKARAPWVPHVKDPLDTSCFDNWDDLVDKMTEDIPPLSRKQAALFKDF